MTTCDMNVLAREPKPFVITLREATWLCKALSSNTARPALSLAAFANWDGAAVLVTCDTHRLHMLRLGDVPDGYPLGPKVNACTGDYKLLDLRRVLFEAKYAKAKDIAISSDLASVQVGIDNGAKAKWEQVCGPVFPNIGDQYIELSKVMPTKVRPVAELFAINSRYLADATMLSSHALTRTLLFSEAASRSPIAFQPDGEKPRWFALVMPMTFESDLEVSE